MITRTHSDARCHSTAVYSDCETYRYALTRVWNPEGLKVAFVMLNPSKATEAHNDPTVERCERRARALGFGAFRVVNIFAFRETSPDLLKMARKPVGPDNESQLVAACRWADQIIAAWGAHGDHLDQGHLTARVLSNLEFPMHHLGLTKHGHPRHPLYVAYAQKPVPWAENDIRRLLSTR